MTYGMYIAAMGAEAQNRRLQVVTHNMANAATPGFKRELAVIQARNSEAVENGSVDPRREDHHNVGGGVMMKETVTDFGKGILKRTGISTDFALKDPEAFFLVEKDGQRLLTRAGNFIFTPDGRLTTQSGDAVLSSNGTPAAIDDPTLPWRATSSGWIQQGGSVTELAIVKPQLGDLVRAGENMFSSISTPPQAGTESRHMLNGYLEQSGVNPTKEMMEMIRTSRAYESNVKMIQNFDHITGQLLARVLRQ